jgi:hypothetical protein
LRGFLSFSLLAVVLVPGLALAAGVEPAKAAGPAVNPALPAAAAAELTEKQMVEQAEKAVAEIERVVGEIQKKLAAARDGKDSLKVNCLGERLKEANGLLSTCRGAATKLSEAAQGKDADTASRQYAMVKAAQTKAGEVRQGADACLGATATKDAPGKNSGVYMTEPGTPATPSTAIVGPPMGRPPHASPTN